MQEFRRFCMGRLGWTPDAFWSATPHDAIDALEGTSEVSGKRKTDLAQIQEAIESVPHRMKSLKVT